MTTKTVLAAGVAAGLAYVTFVVCSPAEPEHANGRGSLAESEAREPDSGTERQRRETPTARSDQPDELRRPHQADSIGDANQALPSQLERAWVRLDRITTKLREAREDLSSLTDQERQALFAEGMAAYDTVLAQANLTGPEAKAELEARYPELRELMLAVKPPRPEPPQPDADGG